MEFKDNIPSNLPSILNQVEEVGQSIFALFEQGCFNYRVTRLQRKQLYLAIQEKLSFMEQKFKIQGVGMLVQEAVRQMKATNRLILDEGEPIELSQQLLRMQIEETENIIRKYCQGGI